MHEGRVKILCAQPAGFTGVQARILHELMPTSTGLEKRLCREVGVLPCSQEGDLLSASGRAGLPRLSRKTVAMNWREKETRRFAYRL